jgi:hypothetical protein
MQDIRKLQQQSLRNVRKLVEQEQAEYERQKRSKRLLIWLVPFLALKAKSPAIQASARDACPASPKS